MKNQTSTPLSFDDIIFEGRNKLYGAFLLRRLYNRHLILATFIAVSAFMLFISIPLISRIILGETTTPPLIIQPTTVFEFEDVVIDIPKPAEVKAEVLPPLAEPVAQKRFTTPVMVNTEVKPGEEMVDVADLKGKVISTTTSDGALSDDLNPPLTIATPGTGAAVGEPKEEIFKYVEEMPVFGAGEKELIAYLSSNFRFPQKAIKAGIDGTIYLSFTVTKTGDIADIKVLKGLGYGIDEEAKRVLASMPQWKPGRQNGREVSVNYNLPFRLKVR